MLDRLSMLGVSWRQGGAESLASFALPDAAAAERLSAFARRFRLAEIAALSTCNRVELIFTRTDETPYADLRRDAFELLTGRTADPGEAERRLRAWQGEGAAEHLFMVAAGLDSACVGEVEIVGQVRAAYERARKGRLAGPVLGLVFDEALKIAARVRGETRLGEGRVSLAEIAVDLVRERLAQTPGALALVGVSPMTERAAVALGASSHPIIIVNRTVAKAEALAATCGGRHLALDAFVASPPPVEVILTSTGAEATVLTEAALTRLATAAGPGRAPLIVDMAIPPDADPEVCARVGVPRIGMDDIVTRAETNRAARIMRAAEARDLVDRALLDLRDRFVERYYGPLFGALQRRYRATAEEGVKRLLRKDLKGLGDSERAAVERWAEALARRFAHIPSVGIKGLLYDGPDGSVEAFLGGLDDELAGELRAALHDGNAEQPEEDRAALEARDATGGLQR